MIDNPDYAALRFWFSVIQFLLTGVIGVYVWFSGRRSAKEKQLTEMRLQIDSRLSDHETRLGKVEAAYKQAPKHADLAGIHEKINDVGHQVAELAGEMKGLASGMAMIQEYLMRKGDQ